MQRFLWATLLAIGLAGSASAAPLPLNRGVGLHEWLNWSPLNPDGSYRWPPYRSEAEWLSGARPLSDWPKGDEFVRMATMGFDFVRLTIDPGPLLDSDGDRRQQALAVLEAAVRRIAAAGLKVVFNLHSVSQVPAYDLTILYDGPGTAGVARYRAMVTDVATMLARIGTDRVAFEPYNEPAFYPCDASGTEDWQQIMADTVADIRAVSADMTVIATGACGGSITGLTDLVPSFDDANVLYSFHMYEPHSFTHQRLDDPAMFGSGLPWPADTSTPQVVIESLRAYMDIAGLDAVRQSANITMVRGIVDEYFAENWGLPQMQARVGEAVTWAQANNIPTDRLFMGEFGVILISSDGRQGANASDRDRYITALRQEAERFDIPWAIFEYSNPVGMTVIEPIGPAEPDAALMRALGLQN